MGIDYVVGQPCGAKRALGLDNMKELLKAKARARSVVEMARLRGDTRPVSQITFESRLARPSERSHQRVQVVDLFEEAAALEPFAADCVHCAARIGEEPFGCWGYIAYPILPSTERWLLDRLPPSLRSHAGRMLVQSVHDFRWDGAPAAQLRTLGRTHFEVGEPLVRRWRGFELSSDQLWQMLFCVGHVRPVHALMCSYFLGVVPHDTTTERVGSFSEEREALLDVVREAQIDVPSAEGQIGDIARFVRALGFSAALALPLVLET